MSKRLRKGHENCGPVSLRPNQRISVARKTTSTSKTTSDQRNSNSNGDNDVATGLGCGLCRASQETDLIATLPPAARTGDFPSQMSTPERTSGAKVRASWHHIATPSAEYDATIVLSQQESKKKVLQNYLLTNLSAP